MSGVTIYPHVEDGPGVTQFPGVTEYPGTTSGAAQGDLLLMSTGVVLLMTGGSLLLV
jgi:hypothetical protein